MNTIQAVTDKSDYSIYSDFLNFRIDGLWLDEMLDETKPNSGLKGLVPTLVPWLEGKKEREIVWELESAERILPKSPSTALCPVLMCPDDCDFFCTVIIAKIKRDRDRIIWEQIGLNETNALDPNDVGKEVEWIQEIGPFEYELEAYEEMVGTFREQYLAHEKEMKDEAQQNGGHNSGSSAASIVTP